MKNVRLIDNIVREIIPPEATPIKDWYNEEFAAQCIEAPDEVEQHWCHDPESGTFHEPEYIPPITTSPFEMLLDSIIQ